MPVINLNQVVLDSSVALQGKLKHPLSYLLKMVTSYFLKIGIDFSGVVSTFKTCDLLGVGGCNRFLVS